MKRRSRRGWALSCTGVGFVLAVAGMMLYLREPLLMARATKIVGTENCYQVLWLSSQELLIARIETGANGDKTYRTYRHDLLTGKETPLTALSRLSSRNGMDTIIKAYLSPDGNWFLSRIDELYDMCAAHPDGSQLRRWEHGDNYLNDPLVWESDSRHFIQFVEDSNGVAALVYDVDRPGQGRRLPFPGSKSITWSYDSDPVLLPGHRVRVGIWKGVLTSIAQSLDYVETGLEAGDGAIRHFSIPLPAGTQLMECAFSPKDDRIAWCLERKDNSSEQRMIAPLMKLLHLYSDSRTSIWVSKRDGSDWHEIGRLEDAKGSGDIPEIYDLGWSPDGTRVHFEHKGAWYTVPAD